MTTKKIQNIKTHLLRSLLVMVMMVWGVGSSWATDYVLVQDGYYLCMNGTALSTTNTFNPSTCVWSCVSNANSGTSSDLSTTSRYIYQTVNGNKYYLTASCSRSGSWSGFSYIYTYSWNFSASTSTTNANVWKSSSADGNSLYAYYSTSGMGSWNRNACLNITSSGVSLDDDVTSNNNKAYKITKSSTTAAVTVTREPAITLVGLNDTNTGVQFSKTDVAGTYTPGYDTYKFNNTPHYFYDESDHDSKPSAINLANGTTYTWSIQSGGTYASLADGVLTTKGAATSQQTVTVALTATNGSYSKTVTSNIKIQDYPESDNAVAGIGDNNIINTVGGTLNLRGYLTGAYTPGYTIYQNDNNSFHHTVADGKDYGYNTPTLDANKYVYTWTLSGEGKNYSALSATNVSNPVLTYNTDAGHDVVATLSLVVTHPDYPSFRKEAGPYNVTLYSTTLAAPTITRVTGTDQVTISVPSEGTTYYTTDGSDPKTSATKQTYSGPITLTTSPTTIKAYSERWSATSPVAEATYKLQLPAPNITFDNGVVTISMTDEPTGTTYRYTTDGSDPTESSTLYDSSNKPTVTNGTTVKAIAVNDNWEISQIAEVTFNISSGVSGGVVTLNDYEDHNWTYYSGVDASVDGGNYNTNYAGKLYSPNPRNVKITYKGNGQKLDDETEISGVQVSITETENTFVYYKTLEEGTTSGEYPYTVISNPFSKRPTGMGFGGWKIIKGYKYIRRANGEMAAENATLNLDEAITFVGLNDNYTVNCTSAEIELQATWVDLNNIVRRTNTGDYTYSTTGGTYETNILVIQRSQTGTITVSSPCTIMMVEPDGSADYRNSYTFTGNITPNNSGVTKIEFTKWNSQNTVNANYKNLWIGRGMTTTNRCANLINGGNTTSTASPRFHVKVESGVYQYMSFLSGYYTSSGNNGGSAFTITGANTNAKITLGNDYDRANGTNTNLQFQYGLTMGRGGSFESGNRSNLHTLDLVVKSGRFGYTFFMENTNTATHLQGGAGYGFYLSSGGNQTYVGCRNITIEGGDLCTVGSGIDRNNVTTNDSGTNRYNDGFLSFNVRIKGGTIHGNVYGGAARSPAGGNRVMIMTGGQVKGWFAAGCNGTADDGGETFGTSYVYIGGKAKVDSEGSTKTLGYANGGNVYAAGAGLSGSTTCGEMTFGTNLVVADESFVERGVYGGGNYGYAKSSTNIYLTGGTNKGDNGTVSNVTTKGGVYGGANQQSGPDVKIWMTGGNMYGGVYGGSNTQGTISGNVTIKATGGQVGTSTTPANIHGGGYGDGTNVTNNVYVNLGYEGQTGNGVKVYGNVYGGAALGTTGGSGKKTKVNVYRGSVTGDVFGGGMGESGSTTKGVVTGDITVDVYGTDPKPSDDAYALHGVYGGGDLAPYSGTPVVTVHNCDNSIEYVYGGGNATSVSGTDVTIYGGNKIGNVFGGGNGQVTAANVNGDTNVKIYGGTIGDVYGGSNSQGQITGTINVSVNAQKEEGHDKCDVNIDNVYGGGNKAASKAGNVSIGCAEHIGAVYGGANQANITGNIDLKINAGHIDNVFGGNNTSGSISGTVTVTVDDSGESCGMKIGNVFGGGNLATLDKGPTVKVLNGSITGNVFGGGKGDSNDHTKGKVTGNPSVTIGTTDSGKTVTIGGDVYGGGDAGDVAGTPVVKVVNNCDNTIGNVYGGGNAADVSGTNVTIDGGQITGAVFGGGHGNKNASPQTEANVNGDVKLTVTGGTVHQVFAGSNSKGNISGAVTFNIDKADSSCPMHIDEVYGGGNEADGNAGTINIGCTGGEGEGIGDVYGGANQANVGNDIVLNVKGGNINRVFGGNNTSGNINGSITVNINEDGSKCGLNLNYVYGAGNQAAYTAPTGSSYGDNAGKFPVVNILKGTVKEDVFGGGLGTTAVVTGNPVVNIDGGNVAGSVYGGGALAGVTGNTNVYLKAGTVTNQIYGGGLGQLEDAAQGKEAVAANITGTTNVTVTGGSAKDVFGCNNMNGAPATGANVTVSAGAITNSVYGGGNLAAASVSPAVSISGGTIAHNVFGGGYGASAVITGTPTIAISGGTISESVYGGGEAASVTGSTQVDVTGGTITKSVYGGGLGNATNVSVATAVTVSGGTITEDVYGGSGFGKVGATTVTINNGADVKRDVFGGGFGQKAEGENPAYEADVNGNVSVTVNKGAKIAGNVYGGNNTNGSPKGTIAVLIDGPVDTTEKAATPLSLKDVFGGGKNAATTSTGAPKVIVKGCETVIARVFGGGDAASAPDTDVEIWGGHITSAFAGGNGENVPAHVGYAADGTTAYETGNGNAKITIKGGTIGNVFGGSNNSGNIRGEVQVDIDKDPDACAMAIANLYGGGNLAPGKGGTLTISCTGDGRVDNVYGGANQADVEGDVTLRITGGNIGNAFGGNNQSGNINGAIHVVVDWTGTTCTNNNLDNVYGGGNLAPYITPEGKTGPLVELINATINNNVYGGGFGAPAKITGNPVVELKGATVTGNVFGGGDAAPVQGNTMVTATSGSAAKVFAGGKGATAVVTGNTTAILNKDDDKTLALTEIYGGGDAAGVTGNTTVTLTKGAVTNAFGGGNQAAITGSTQVDITGATAANVYGGGNLAGVSEKATINMTGGSVTAGLYGGCNSEGTVTGDVAVNVTGGTVGTAESHANVHGGGYGAQTATAGNVAVAINGADVTINGDVYGGSALGNVNDATDDNTTVTLTAGTVNGNIYGGGLGDASNAALVNGAVAVNINGGSVTGMVFGCNNVNGTPKGAVTVTVADGANANLSEVYGGGNMATYSPTTAQAPRVVVNGCDNTIGYVYGGGNAADVPATDVTIWGGTIGNVFGGGHGNKDATPATAANVTGNVSVAIKGGTITNVFAGSNSKGTIGGATSLTIEKDGDCAMHIGDVYGGGNEAAGNAGTITIGCTGDEGEGIQNVYGGANKADIGTAEHPSNIALLITGGNIGNVFGGNNQSGTINGTINVTVNWNGSCTNNHINNVYGGGNQAAYTGSPAVAIKNGTVSQNVFGGGLGTTAVVTGNPVVTIGDADVAASVATVQGDVYGGGDAAAVSGTTQVNVIAKENTTINNVYGGGNAADVSGTDVNIDGGRITGMVFGGGHGNAANNVAANVNGNVAVDVTGGTINKVFGGSNDKGNITGSVAVNIHKEDNSNAMHITEVYGGGNVAAGNAGQVSIGCTGGADEGIGTVYGGANNADVGNNIVLNISGGSIGDVFGGNNNGGSIAGTIKVNVNWTGSCGTNKLDNVYGGGNIASYTGNPEVNIINTTMTGSVFGGGKGQTAVVVGDPVVNIGKWTEGTVSIDGNVFGGGDLAAVEGSPQVTVRDCATQILGDLYGGGNAAPVYATNTTVWGGTIAGNIFGGGNGSDATKNAKGAQVGYQRDDTTAGGTGIATTNVYGGTVGTWNGNECTSGGGIFGGSNTNGNIRGEIQLTVDQRTSTEASATKCTLKMREIYGGGNEAAYAGEGINFNLGCVDALDEIYGGAKNADLNQDVVLNITSGTFKKVFGGNNMGGKLNGSITVNIEETGCNPIVIEELYGGGNKAAYSVYGYDDDGTVLTSGTAKNSPVVNVISCTHIGKVFGGGYGAKAVMVGNPTVNIQEVMSTTDDFAKRHYNTETKQIVKEDDDQLGTIGEVFGGGNAADIIGNTYVNVATNADTGANILGNIYGGGNAADVTGKTNVVVGK